jgi:hypothetical protein
VLFATTLAEQVVRISAHRAAFKNANSILIANYFWGEILINTVDDATRFGYAHSVHAGATGCATDGRTNGRR